MYWKTEELSSGFVASCLRWLRELVKPRPAEERRGVLTVRTGMHVAPIAGALIERTWRGQWTTSVCWAVEGVDMARARPAHRSFEAAKRAFHQEVEAAVVKALWACAPAPAAKPVAARQLRREWN